MIFFKLFNKINSKLNRFLLFFFRTRSFSKDVLFLVEFPESYSNFEGLIKLYNSSGFFNTHVFFYEGNYAKKNNSNFKFIKKIKGVSYIGSIEKKFDTIFIHNPFDHERSKKHSFYNLFFNSNKIVYISYGVEIAGDRTKSQFNLPAQKYSDFIFVHSESSRLQYQLYCTSGANHVKPLGHPFYDFLSLKNENLIKYDFMICFHHSIDKGSFDLCTFDKFITLLIVFFKTNNKFNCLFRPHPMLKAKLEDMNKIDEFNSFINLNNVKLDDNTDFRKSFLETKNLITDIGSFIMIFPFLKRPMMILSNDKSKLGYDGDVFLDNLCFNPLDLSKFLNESICREKYIINTKPLNIKTNNISKNIFRFLTKNKN